MGIIKFEYEDLNTTKIDMEAKNNVNVKMMEWNSLFSLNR